MTVTPTARLYPRKNRPELSQVDLEKWRGGGAAAAEAAAQWPHFQEAVANMRTVTLQVSHGLQLQYPWLIPIAAVTCGL